MRLLVTCLSLILICGVLVTISEVNSAAQTPNCSPPPGQGTNTVWRQNATINVGIDPTFSTDQQNTIKDQLNKWKNAGGLNVTFTFPTTANLGPGAAGGGNPIYFIFKETPDNPVAQGQTGGFGYNGRRGDSTTKINPGVTNLTTFAQVASHEIGHSFGLDDCTSCAKHVGDDRTSKS